MLKFLLKDTWHLCVHDFMCQSVQLDATEAEYLCKKCGVASKIYYGKNIIFVNPKTNHPFKMNPWQLNKKNCKGVVI